MTDRTPSHLAKMISQVGQYIYDHRDQNIPLDGVADYTGYSKYHFNRIFFAATGFQLGEFIQRKKLEHALYAIQQGNHNFLEVALSIGYESASAFTRAFKKNFAVTPSEVAAGRHPANPRAGAHPPKKRFDSQSLKPAFKTLPTQTVYGINGQGFSDQSYSTVASELFQRLAKMADPLPYDALQPIGVSMDNPWVGEQADRRFFAGFLAGISARNDQLDSFTWQGGEWAVFSHVGAHNTMWQTISQVYAQWVVPNGVRLTDQFIVQRYINHPMETPSSSLVTELYFPLA